jgi:uncharacterized SAM-binding protein YcdF (DUF218 family)
VTSRRLVAVLGYSRGGDSLHEICAARLREAEAVARPGDVVLLSGWSRRHGRRSEAELMAQAWRGPDVELVVGADARTTYGNAVDAVRTAAAYDVDELVLVTSRWHERRAAALFRAALGQRKIGLSLAAADGAPATRTRLRELICQLFTPVLAGLLRKRLVEHDLATASQGARAPQQ